MHLSFYMRTCVVTMSHRNVQPHVSITWRATDTRGHWWGAPTPLYPKKEVDGGILSRTCFFFLPSFLTSLLLPDVPPLLLFLVGAASAVG